MHKYRITLHGSQEQVKKVVEDVEDGKRLFEWEKIEPAEISFSLYSYNDSDLDSSINAYSLGEALGSLSPTSRVWWPPWKKELDSLRAQVKEKVQQLNEVKDYEHKTEIVEAIKSLVEDVGDKNRAYEKITKGKKPLSNITSNEGFKFSP
jgi:hypothetical protein